MPFGGLLPHNSFFIVCLLACLISLPALITIACDRTVDRPVPSFVLNHHGSGVAVMGSTCTTTRRGVVLGTPGGDRVDAARGWQAAGQAARPPRPREWPLAPAWAAAGGADARARGGWLSGRRSSWRLCGVRAPPRGHARGRHIRRSPAAAIHFVSSYRIGGFVSHCT